MIYLELFWTFFKIGAFTFGGGYAMIPLIQKETVEKHGWISDKDILEIVAIAESTPGPIAVNSATFVGIRVAGLPGAIVALLAGAAVVWRGGLALPTAPAGWWGLALLTLLYGTGITILFTVLPRLGVVGNSAVMNVEPVFALVLAWLILDQHIAPVQVVGALVVVGAVIWLGTRRK